MFLSNIRKQLWASGMCNYDEFAHKRSRVQDPVDTVLSTESPTDNHHISIIKLSLRWCVCVEGFSGRVLPKTLKWVAVYSSLTFHING